MCYVGGPPERMYKVDGSPRRGCLRCPRPSAINACHRQASPLEVREAFLFNLQNYFVQSRNFYVRKMVGKENPDGIISLIL